MEKYDNKIILQGKVLFVNAKKEEKEPKITSIVIETTASRDGTKKNRIMVMCFGNQAKESVKYKSGDFIRVTGNMQVRKQSNAEGKQSNVQNVVAEEIAPAKTRTEEEYDMKGMGLYAKVNEAYMMGIVTGISDYGRNMKCIAIRTIHNGIMSNIMAKIYVNTYNEKTVNELKIGDNICIAGTIQVNSRKGKEKRTLYFENLIITDISKIA
ncbi:MAG: single-stranded DNA-binding protein [Ruminococcus flavefaciens]|nr:single-stranded DNA-binding protein [Ruminococcus flavefaciens]